MQPFTVVKGIAAPMMERDVNTDIVIRIERLITFGRTELEPYAFEAWRYRPDRSENPDFILNQEPYRRAKILLNGVNFGCGSSREAAVWALQCIGIRCVIAPSFGDIFFNNCFQNGVLPIRLPLETIESMAAEARATPSAEFTVDLTQNAITTPSGQRIGFTVDPGRRTMLLEGLDEIGLTLRREHEITGFQMRDRSARPWIYERGVA